MLDLGRPDDLDFDEILEGIEEYPLSLKKLDPISQEGLLELRPLDELDSRDEVVN